MEDDTLCEGNKPSEKNKNESKRIQWWWQKDDHGDGIDGYEYDGGDDKDDVNNDKDDDPDADDDDDE